MKEDLIKKLANTLEGQTIEKNFDPDLSSKKPFCVRKEYGSSKVLNYRRISIFHIFVKLETEERNDNPETDEKDTRPLHLGVVTLSITKMFLRKNVFLIDGFKSTEEHFIDTDFSYFDKTFEVSINY